MYKMLAIVLISSVGAVETDLIHDLTWQEYLFSSLMCAFLVLFAGMMSGLTVGLMSIDPLDLELKQASGSELERRQCVRVHSIISDHHTLLVTLLVANAIAMETLPIFLDQMFSSVLAIVISVTLVLIFGEILPQALCTGPNQLAIAYRLVPLVKCIVILFRPISFPIVKILDRCFGSDHSYKKYESEDLKTLVALHEYKHGHEQGLSPGQIRIIHGAIDLDKKLARDYMINLEDVFMLDYDSVLTEHLLNDILQSGFSRIPVFSEKRENVTGVLLVKRLVEVPPGISIRDSGITLRPPVMINSESMLLDVLNKFHDCGTYMAFVTSASTSYRDIIGILTLKDSLSVVLNTYFFDEDEYQLSPVVQGICKTERSLMLSLRRMLNFSENRQRPAGSTGYS